MTDQKQPNFVAGMFWNDPHQNAPQFVKGKISFRVKEFVDYLRANYDKDSEYVNVILKESKNGKMYFELDTWKPKPQAENSAQDNFGQDIDQRANEVLENQDDIRVENIPF